VECLSKRILKRVKSSRRLDGGKRLFKRLSALNKRIQTEIKKRIKIDGSYNLTINVHEDLQFINTLISILTHIYPLLTFKMFGNPFTTSPFQVTTTKCQDDRKVQDCCCQDPESVQTVMFNIECCDYG
jgi:hypothetical protein